MHHHTNDIIKHSNMCLKIKRNAQMLTHNKMKHAQMIHRIYKIFHLLKSFVNKTRV